MAMAVLVLVMNVVVVVDDAARKLLGKRRRGRRVVQSQINEICIVLQSAAVAACKRGCALAERHLPARVPSLVLD
jgi:hypothetical protein